MLMSYKFWTLNGSINWPILLRICFGNVREKQKWRLVFDIILPKTTFFENLILSLQLDQFFYNSDFFKNHGYIRTIAYRFRQGGSNSNEIGTNYVKVVLEHQFIANSTLSLEAFNAKFTQMLTDINGKFSKSFSVVPQALIEGKIFGSSSLIFLNSNVNHFIFQQITLVQRNLCLDYKQ